MINPSLRRPSSGNARLRRTVGVIGLVVAMVITAGCEGTPQTNCQTSNPGGAYSVELCLSTFGSTEAGDFVVSAAVTVSPAGAASVAKVIFSLDGGYLLTDYEAPYSFALPSRKFVDGAKTLSAVANLRDGNATGSTAVTLQFANGISAPPVNTNHFIPTSGTAPAPGQPFVLVAAGDGASGRSQAADVVSLIASYDPNLFLYIGDVYEKGTPTEFRNWYGPPGFGWGRFRSITNPAIGNHEYENGVAPGYFDYWDNIPDYYSYNAHGWHFIALNSNLSGSPGSTQYNWLAADLQANAAPCTIAYFHHPVLNIGSEAPKYSFDPVWKLLADNGVDIVLNGHDHNYQHWRAVDRNYVPDANGMTEFVAAASGQGVRPFTTTDPRVVAGFDTYPQAVGALRFELNPAGAAFTYQNTAGATLDQGVIGCNGAGADTQAPTAPGALSATVNDGPSVALAWQPSTDNVGVSGYTVLRDGAPVATVPSAQTTYVDDQVAPNSTVTYTVEATDAAGNVSPPSNSRTVTVGGIPTTITAAASADTYVSADAPTIKYGTATVLRADTSPDLHSYLRFNLSTLSGPVQSATLRVYANSNHTAGFSVQDVADDTWGETSTTFKNAPTVDDTVASSGPLTAGTYVDIDISSLITGNGTYSLALSGINSTSLSVGSRESANPPMLIVNQNVP